MLDKQSLGKVQNIVLIVDGGIGKNIMSTVVIRNLKKAYPDKDITVVSGYQDVFLNSPNLKRIYNMGMGQQKYFFEDFILNAKTIVIKVEPYYAFEYIYKEKHCVECWCDMADIPCDNIYPEIYFNKHELDMSRFHLEKYKSKNIVLLQHSGGKAPENNTQMAQIVSSASMYRRNLPQEVTQELVNKLTEKGYKVLSIQQPNQFTPQNAEIITHPIRALIALIPYVKGIIAIDSFLQHAAAAMKKQALVLWGGTSPKVLGYDLHLNLTREDCPNPFCHRPNSYLFDYQPHGFLWDCPYDDRCMNYKPEDIVKEFEKICPIEKEEQKEVKETKQEKPCQKCEAAV